MSFWELGGVSFCGLVGFAFLLESPHWKSAGTAWLVGVDWQGVQYRFCGGLLARMSEGGMVLGVLRWLSIGLVTAQWLAWWMGKAMERDFAAFFFKAPLLVGTRHKH